MREIRRRSSKELPDSFCLASSFDLTERKVLAVGLNVLAAVSIVAYVALFLALVRLLRPGLTGFSLQTSVTGGSFLVVVLRVVILSMVMVILHEGTHGVVFRIYNGEWGVFAFKGLYAYAAAPDWYMPRDHHIVAALAPFVVLSVLGTALIPIVPQGWLTSLVLLLILNAAGAMGDLAIVVWLLTKSPDVFVKDYGDGVAVYAPKAEAGSPKLDA